MKQRRENLSISARIYPGFVLAARRILHLFTQKISPVHNATQPILPLLAQTFNVNKAGISLTVLASTLGVALSAPFMGRLADRVGRRRIIIASATLLGVTSILAATSATLPQLIFWRFADSGGWRSAFRTDVDHDSEVMPISVPN